MTKIIVIDSMPGEGKTSYAIQMINNDRAKGFGYYQSNYILNNKYLYVTPFLKEIKRIQESTRAEFYDPSNDKNSKYSSLLELLNEEVSIIISHELFSRLSNETLSKFKEKDYILIMDEVADVIDDVVISEDDISLLIKSKTIKIDEEDKVIWKDCEYQTNKINKFSDIKVFAERDSLYLNKNHNKMFKQMSVESFLSFKKVYILTYLFEGQFQKYYFDAHGLEYEIKSVLLENGEYRLISYNKKNEPRDRIKNLLHIYEDIQNTTGRPSLLNTNYNKSKKQDEYYLLSSTWFNKANKNEINQLKNNLDNYFRFKVKTDKNDLFWTTIKDYAPKISGIKCKYENKNKKEQQKFNNFLPLNIRATNEYGHCTSMAYVYNRFPNPFKVQYFKQKEIDINEDLYAVSELIQFLFRGCIRNNQPMNCYIPSYRMRKLLYDWMNFKI